MLQLNKIRNNFEPYLPFRWKVKFSDSSLNILASEAFPAKTVEFEEVEIKSIKVPIVAGVEVSMHTHASDTRELSIVFFDNSKRAVINYLKEYYSYLKSAGSANKYLEASIFEYGNNGSIINSSFLLVQLEGKLVTMLGQDAIPYEAPLTFNVIGRNTNRG